MGKNLVIVESPTKAKTIEKYLGKENFQVEASRGHIRDLPDGKLAVDTDSGYEPSYIIPDDKKRIVAALRSAAEKADKVWLASDEDREGEAIAWHLCEALELDPARTNRIVFHEITKTAIQHAVENPRTIDMNLVKAQQARRVLDRLVGYELSPILWRKIHRGLSAGRVQSVAVKLIVDREREISAFNSQSYYRVEGLFKTEDGSTVKALLDKHFKTAEEALAFLEKCREAKVFSVNDVETKSTLRAPASPFTTSLLQQEAARKLGLSVAQTMATAQRLYEAGLITYMRTDSTNLSSLAINTAKQAILGLYGEEYSRPRTYKTRSKGAQEAHEAIRPTYIDRMSIEGTGPEKRLYELIWKRTIASQMADARLERTTITIGGDTFDEHFIFTGEKILFDGFLKVYIEGRDDEEQEEMLSLLPNLGRGSILARGDISALQSYTQAPPRYNQASLVKKLEELGIGRPSTYSPTIKTILDRGYVVEGNRPAFERPSEHITLKGDNIQRTVKMEKAGAEKKRFFPENIGIAVTDYLSAEFGDIVDYGFTARVEEEFDKIAEGKLKWDKMVDSFYVPFHDRIKHTDKGFIKKAERELGVDPQSGKPVYARIARYGAVVQLGTNDDPDKRFANLGKGQLIENVTLEEALHLLILPRTLGTFGNGDLVASIGRLGPYIRYTGEDGKAHFVSLPKEMSPYTVTEAEARALAEADSKGEGTKKNEQILTFEKEDIVVLKGMYGPYIKHAGANYKIPRGTDPYKLTLEDALAIIEKGPVKKSERKKK